MPPQLVDCSIYGWIMIGKFPVFLVFTSQISNLHHSCCKYGQSDICASISAKSQTQIYKKVFFFAFYLQIIYCKLLLAVTNIMTNCCIWNAKKICGRGWHLIQLIWLVFEGCLLKSIF